MNDLKQKLESLLFVSSKPLHVDLLAKFAAASLEDTKTALIELSKERQNSGIVLLSVNDTYQLATHPSTTETVTGFLNSELREKLTDASLEVLAIIAYRQPITKAEIEAIRGVNCQYSIRQLLMRGLIEKSPTTKDFKGTAYQATTEFLQQLGLTSIHELPNFEGLQTQVALPDSPTTATND